MFSVNVNDLRNDRQKVNNEIISSILMSGDVSELKKNCNNKALNRVIEFVSLSLEDIITKSQVDDHFRRMIAMYIAKSSTRQGSKDEKLIIDGISAEIQKVGVCLKSLSASALRAVKNSSKVLTQKEYKKAGLTKYDCLKSFDAELSGEVSGYVFAKVLTGWVEKSDEVIAGGHQDNVIHEAKEFCEWAKEFGEEGKVYVCLIDTDIIECYNKLKKCETESVWVVDHKEFQTRLGVS